MSSARTSRTTWSTAGLPDGNGGFAADHRAFGPGVRRLVFTLPCRGRVAVARSAAAGWGGTSASLSDVCAASPPPGRFAADLPPAGGGRRPYFATSAWTEKYLSASVNIARRVQPVLRASAAKRAGVYL